MQFINWTKGNDLVYAIDLFKTYIYHALVYEQINNPTSLRLVAEYNENNKSWVFDPLLTYRINPFSIFYIGMTSGTAGYPLQYEKWERIDPLLIEPNRTLSIADYGSKSQEDTRLFFMKLQYLFQM